MSVPKIYNKRYSIIYAVCAIMMIPVLYLYFLGFTYYISDNISAEKLGTITISLSVFSSNLIVTFMPINNTSKFKIYIPIVCIFSAYIFAILQYKTENNIVETILIICLSIQPQFQLLTRNIDKISNRINNALIIFPILIAIPIILFLFNDPNFEYYDPVLIICTSIISLALINSKSTSNMNIFHKFHSIIMAIMIIILTIIFTYVIGDLVQDNLIEETCMYSTTDCESKTIGITNMALSGILLLTILATYREIKWGSYNQILSTNNP